LYFNEWGCYGKKNVEEESEINPSLQSEIEKNLEIENEEKMWNKFFLNCIGNCGI
jgi:hypothetical protein